MTRTAEDVTEVFLAGAGATARVGAALGRALRPGDAVLISGGLGAGKSALARAAIAALLADEGRAEDIPSPTFTLVQVYETDAAEIWHADLYRLSGPGEVGELGLAEAFESAICLVEWPDRLGTLAPARALGVALSFEGEGRRMVLTPRGAGWGAILAAVRDAA